jgi:hypothetical protein
VAACRHPDPSRVDVRTVADHPLVSNGATSSFFAELAEPRRSGRTLGPDEMTASYARHAQVMVDP